MRRPSGAACVCPHGTAGQVQSVPQALTLALSFSLQTEGTRLQKDLRTYLASVKGKGQGGSWGRPGLGRWAAWDIEGSLPHEANGDTAGVGTRVCGGGVSTGSGDPLTSWAFEVGARVTLPVPPLPSSSSPRGPGCSMALLPHSHARGLQETE